MRRSAASVLMSCAFLLHDDPTFAQSSSAFEHARGSFTSVQQYVAAEAIPRRLSPPPNLVVSPLYRRLVESMLRDSPTFRRQCMRIAGEPELTVRLGITSPPQISSLRAMTRLKRNAKGHLTANVDLAFSRDTEELIAHEFEHIIEQLDGVDLAAQVAQRDTGVTLVGHTGDMFETARAKRVGLRVVSELQR
jgi:hypothetical protein